MMANGVVSLFALPGKNKTSAWAWQRESRRWFEETANSNLLTLPRRTAAKRNPSSDTLAYRLGAAGGERRRRRKKRSVSPPQNVSWEGNLPTTNCCGDPSNSRQDEKSENGGDEIRLVGAPWGRSTAATPGRHRGKWHFNLHHALRVACGAVCACVCVCALGVVGSEDIKRLIPQHQRGSEVGKSFLGASRLPHLHNKQVFRTPEETGGVNRKLPLFLKSAADT